MLPVIQMNISPSTKYKNGFAMVNENSAANQRPTGEANTNANVIITNCINSIVMITAFMLFNKYFIILSPKILVNLYHPIWCIIYRWVLKLNI